MKSSIFKPVFTKISKTAQTRGADDDVIFQNRVNRNNTVLIPYNEYEFCKISPSKDGKYENGFIVLIKPEDYFNQEIQKKLHSQGLKLGINLLVFYETRQQWNKFPLLKKWKAASSRTAPLLGEYVARIPATTAKGQPKIIEGFSSTNLKGAGIRVYEYADTKTIDLCKLQLEYLFWSCYDIEIFLDKCGDEKDNLISRKNEIIKNAQKEKVADNDRLKKERIINDKGHTICPLCLKEISALEFASKLIQAEGREVPDLTVTNISLFHIHELRTGQFNHRLYNLGWGHHHCNVTIADKGVEGTLNWMKEILIANSWI